MYKYMYIYIYNICSCACILDSLICDVYIYMHIHCYTCMFGFVCFWYLHISFDICNFNKLRCVCLFLICSVFSRVHFSLVEIWSLNQMCLFLTRLPNHRKTWVGLASFASKSRNLSIPETLFETISPMSNGCVL